MASKQIIEVLEQLPEDLNILTVYANTSKVEVFLHNESLKDIPEELIMSTFTEDLREKYPEAKNDFAVFGIKKGVILSNGSIIHVMFRCLD